MRNQELSPSAVSNRSNDEPNEVTYSAMESAEKDEDIYGPFGCVSEMMDNLNQ
ncbi:MAG: hypothetical protein LUE14_07855 [Clostridiales bacterium]|nr:hypothetical protein [Clostridiales bacterium]